MQIFAGAIVQCPVETYQSDKCRKPTIISDDVGLCIDLLQPKEEESWERLTAVSSSIFAFVVHSAQLVQWILHNLTSTQLPPDYDKNSMIENYTKKITTHQRAHRFAPPR